MSEKVIIGPQCIDAAIGAQPDQLTPRYFVEWSYTPWSGDRIGWVDFKLWVAQQWTEDASGQACVPGFPLRRDEECHGSPYSTTLGDCQPTVEGFRKWDGCTQWEWCADMHFDDAEDMDQFWTALRYCMKHATALMAETWDGGLTP